MDFSYTLDYYKMGLFSDADMASYIALGWITQAQLDAVKTTTAA